jgi:hypothetical protein
LALEDAPSGIFTNSAVVIDPCGEVVCRYDKINAESRWACPGNPRRDNTFETPWGRVGVLICSDSYYGLMPRVTALRGADLLLVLANWPSAALEPRELWRVRAMENGLYLAACNRTGIDRIMDCRDAFSCLCDPRGCILVEEKCEASRMVLADIALNRDGRLDGAIRRQKLSERCPEEYHDSYLNLRPIRDLTGFLSLPQPGVLPICSVVPGHSEHPVDALVKYLEDGEQTEGLYLLPPFPLAEAAYDRIGRCIQSPKVGVLTHCTNADTETVVGLQVTGEPFKYWRFSPTMAKTNELPRFDFGPARVHLASFSTLAHPEPAVAAAKQGCDLLLAYHHQLTAEDRMLAGARTLEGLAVAISTPTGAGIFSPPEGHQRWQEALAGEGECCRLALDTQRIRSKSFQDNIDFEVLLRQTVGSNE